MYKMYEDSLFEVCFPVLLEDRKQQEKRSICSVELLV